MPNINITVTERIATNTTPGEVIVCGNSDYKVTFKFDAEWETETNRVARFIYYKDGLSIYQDVALTGNTVAVPILYGVDHVLVGVYAGDLRTTTPAKVLCDRSILCGDPLEAPPEKARLLQEQIDGLSTAHGQTRDDVDALREQIGGLSTAHGQTRDDVDALREQIGGLSTAHGQTRDDVNDLMAIGLSVVGGKVCIDAFEVAGSGWTMLEPAATLPAPYAEEYGWTCDDRPQMRDLYEWVYRCFFEGFSVPYRTILVGGEEYKFDTELTRYNAEWWTIANDKLGDPGFNLEANGAEPSEAAYFCVPLVQFGTLTNDEIKIVCERVRHDNPALCCPPIAPDCIVRDENGRALYCYCIFQTKETVEKIQVLTAQAERAIDDMVKAEIARHRATMPLAKLSYESEKKIAAKVIHDYLVINANPSVANAGGNPKINVWRGSLFAVLDPNQQALCDGYTQAFNYFARLYGITSIVSTGTVYKNGAELGGHTWVSVNLVDTYQDYASDPTHWSAIDVYWDEPLHEAANGGNPDREDVIWEYFLKPANIFEQPEYAMTREMTAETSYGVYPFEGNPGKAYDDHGEDLYMWNIKEG